MTATNNLVTKPYLKQTLKTELKKLEQRRDKSLDSKLNGLKIDLRAEIKGSIAEAKHDIISEIKEDNSKTRTEILGAVADFGKRVQDLEGQMSIVTHNISELQHLS